MTTPMQEPDTHGAPLREYTDPAYRPLCANLADVRANIDRLDDEIVRLIAERAMYVKDAARFKRDAFQVSAPARQAQVFDKARALAERHNRASPILSRWWTPRTARWSPPSSPTSKPISTP